MACSPTQFTTSCSTLVVKIPPQYLDTWTYKVHVNFYYISANEEWYHCQRKGTRPATQKYIPDPKSTVANTTLVVFRRYYESASWKYYTEYHTVHILHGYRKSGSSRTLLSHFHISLFAPLFTNNTHTTTNEIKKSLWKKCVILVYL